ncbi:MAG: hypothetical protein JNM00_11860, partial [Flavobacteriales bacterium]|nr:hypothetical protein [Flavobacteriales bacterium]
MKLRLAIAACLLGISNFSAYSQILGDPIYYQDFSAGIPSDWDSLNTTGIAHWEYRGPNTSPDLSVASRGSCGASSSLIQSLTYDNGFVIFDSNYWDDDGDVCGNLGSGQDPAPHTAALTTAPIDLTGVNTVVFTWQQHFKRYQSTLTVAVSNDGGNNWNTIYTAALVYTSATEWQTFNVSAYAANQADFRIRFLFSGTYYWWQLDDIALYAPNANDIRILNPKYTTYNPTDTIPFNNMEYDSYPSVMIPPIKFSAEDQNIGGNSQTGCKLITKVKKAGDLTQMFNIQSGSTTIAPGQTVTHNIATTYTAPTTPENYIITYNVDQTQNDDDVSNNWDTLDFRITPFSYARDERTMEDAFTPSLVYQDETQQIGNVFQARLSSPKKCHAIGVGFSDLSEPGTVVHGVIYKLNTWEILAETEDYVVNIADLNAVGDEKIVSLPLITPLDLQQDSLYIVMVSHDAAQGGSMRVARSGDALPNVALLKYPDSNGLFYLLKHPMVRMHIFAASSTPGCTDPAADNYMPEADVDDGGCLFFGCTNVEACNFDPLANHDDGSCFLNYGCTNPAACNFDPIANCDDGSCLVDYGCMNPAACNYDPAATCEDGSCLVDYGCTNTAACNFDPVATCDDGSCLDDYGCMNPDACNYDPAATCEDGSCLVDYGCMNPVACNYDPAATCDDGSCLVDYGCMNPVACNYDPAAT